MIRGFSDWSLWYSVERKPVLVLTPMQCFGFGIDVQLTFGKSNCKNVFFQSSIHWTSARKESSLTIVRAYSSLTAIPGHLNEHHGVAQTVPLRDTNLFRFGFSEVIEPKKLNSFWKFVRLQLMNVLSQFVKAKSSGKETNVNSCMPGDA